MKIFRYILLTSLTCTLFSCGPDELIPEPVPPVVNPGDKDEPGEEPEQPEEPAKIQLSHHRIAAEHAADQGNHRGFCSRA